MWRSHRQEWLFRDREDGGRQLASLLLRYAGERPFVLALPRGGVVVAYEVARTLHAPLDVIVARKVGVPGHRELGMGAIAPGGVRVIDQATVDYLGVTPSQVERVVAEETAEMDRRLRAFRDDLPVPDLRGCTAIVVDDGLATGVTARAAVRSARLLQPRGVVLAVPVCAPETAESLRGEVDDLVCVACPDDFIAVGLWYADFSQTTDQEVVDLLERSRRELATGSSAGRTPGAG